MANINFWKTGIWSIGNVYFSLGFVIYLFLLCNDISRKKCADLTEHHNNMEQKIFHKILLLVSNFFPDLIGWKQKFGIIIVTFHPKHSVDEIFDITWREMQLALAIYPPRYNVILTSIPLPFRRCLWLLSPRFFVLSYLLVHL